MEILISVIIPVYNTGEELLKCVESIINNTYTSVEVLIIDDGSKFETAQLCDICYNRFPNVRVFHRENEGVSATRNFGLEHCNGEYVMFVDSDDLLKEDAIELLYNLCRKHDADFAMAGYTECMSNGKSIGINTNGEHFIWKDGEILDEFLVGGKIGWNVWAKLYRKSILKEIRFPIGKRTAEDMFFIYQVCRASSKAVLNCVSVYDYIKHSDSAMADLNCIKFFDTYEMIKRVWSEYENFDNIEQKNNGKVFYVKNTLWFLRFILAKDIDRKCTKEIQQVRKELLRMIGQYGTFRLTPKTKIESWLLENFYPLFKVYAMIYALKIRNRNS